MDNSSLALPLAKLATINRELTKIAMESKQAGKAQEKYDNVLRDISKALGKSPAPTLTGTPDVTVPTDLTPNLAAALAEASQKYQKAEKTWRDYRNSGSLLDRMTAGAVGTVDPFNNILGAGSGAALGAAVWPMLTRKDPSSLLAAVYRAGGVDPSAPRPSYDKLIKTLTEKLKGSTQPGVAGALTAADVEAAIAKLRKGRGTMVAGARPGGMPLREFFASAIQRYKATRKGITQMPGALGYIKRPLQEAKALLKGVTAGPWEHRMGKALTELPQASRGLFKKTITPGFVEGLITPKLVGKAKFGRMAKGGLMGLILANVLLGNVATPWSSPESPSAWERAEWGPKGRKAMAEMSSIWPDYNQMLKERRDLIRTGLSAAEARKGQLEDQYR